MTNFYHIISQQIEAGHALFHVQLPAQCPVYKGHFPGHPIAPGACHIEMIRECASVALGKEMHWNHIKQCKFLVPLEPDKHHEADVDITWSEKGMTAVVTSGETTSVKLKVSCNTLS